MNIKCSKTDQGAVGVRVILGRTEDDLCPVSALSKRGKTPGALFQWENQIPLPKTKFVEATQLYLLLTFQLRTILDTALEQEQQPQLQLLVWKIQLYRRLEDGRALHINCIFGQVFNSWQQCCQPYQGVPSSHEH